MRGIVVPSGIKRPFAPIDRAVLRAFQKLQVEVTPLAAEESFRERLPSLVADTNPDFILVLMGWRLGADNWQQLKRVPRIPKIAWMTDDPYYSDWSRTVGKYVDVVFTNESAAVPVYRAHGCQCVHHLPLGVDPTDFFPRQTVPARYHSDVLVLGTAFNNRRRWVRQLLPYLTRTKLCLVGPGWDRADVFLKSPARGCVRKRVVVRPHWVSVAEANNYYNGAKIVLNLNRSPRDEYLKLNRAGVAANTPNNRTFEVAACAAFQLVQYRPDLSSLYPAQDRSGKSRILSFRSVGDAIRLMTYYLPRIKRRVAIATDVYRETLQAHQYVHRIEKLCAVLKKFHRSDQHDVTVTGETTPL
ncbi:CgeB family protein [Numidum massiliense]|uniref:CgeB family protein n=1 Tax=Numidum massiliense TaxID=1522315 RepID=UPI0006D567E2|nr:DUF3880 domain-containing protein [Numidum massiliense]